MANSGKGQAGRVHLTLGNEVTADDGTTGRITGIFRSPKPGDHDVRVQDTNGQATAHKSRDLRDRD
jgi:hypothetical protein